MRKHPQHPRHFMKLHVITDDWEGRALLEEVTAVFPVSNKPPEIRTYLREYDSTDLRDLLLNKDFKTIQAEMYKMHTNSVAKVELRLAFDQEWLDKPLP